jgi:hypothetical protein
MSRRAVIGLWIAFAFVTWNVIFDRLVAAAALEFTQEQIARYERGEPTARIDDAFQPHVRRAALVASIPAGAILAGGLVVVKLASRRREA